MIKVLHFVSTPAIWSGVMSVIMNYYRHIDRSRVQFDFLCFLPCEESYEKEINELGGQVFFISKPSASPHTLKELTAFFKKHQGEYQWLHNHEVYLSFLLKPISEHYGIKDFIVHSHATRYSDRKWAAVRNRILCFPIRFMKCHRFACSEAAGFFLFKECWINQHEFKIIPNAIERTKFTFDEDLRNRYRKELSLEKSFVIFHIGRFVHQKNHSFLLKIFSDIASAIPSAKLILVGNGPLKESVKQLAYDLGIIDKIIFLGQRKDVPALLQAADLFILPSIYEGLPISCLEAQAAGLPCLISDMITDEICLNKNVIRLPLNNTNIWLKECQSYYTEFCKKGITERDRHSLMVPDIVYEATELSHFYENANS